MDGVLADFELDATVMCGMLPSLYESLHGPDKFWEMINSNPNFYRELQMMPDARDLMDVVKYLPHAVLTGIPRGMDPLQNQKREWLKEYFPGTHIICTQASKKYEYAMPGDILIDDRIRYAKKWESAGGIFIRHFSARTTIQNLEALGVI